MVDKEKDIKEDFTKMCEPMILMERALKACNPSMVAQSGEPTESRFDYPVWRRRNKDNAAIMQRSETHLDVFWSYVDKVMREKAGALTGTAVKKLLASRILQRTPEWSDAKTGDGRPTNRDIVTPAKPLSEVYFELKSRTSKSLSDTAYRVLKGKVKTRGVPSTKPSMTAAAPAADDFDPQPTFAVDARALKVFRTLFFVPSATATPGEVAWTDFVHALASTGFGAEKLYGSVWHFTPTNLDVERSIQFHEPPPLGKIPFRMARRHGRRLYRAYGWHGGMFVMQEKKPKVPVEDGMAGLRVRDLVQRNTAPAIDDVD